MGAPTHTHVVGTAPSGIGGRSHGTDWTFLPGPIFRYDGCGSGFLTPTGSGTCSSLLNPDLNVTDGRVPCLTHAPDRERRRGRPRVGRGQPYLHHHPDRRGSKQVDSLGNRPACGQRDSVGRVIGRRSGPDVGNWVLAVEPQVLKRKQRLQVDEGVNRLAFRQFVNAFLRVTPAVREMSHSRSSRVCLCRSRDGSAAPLPSRCQ